MDIRIEKTKRSIYNAFLELRARKPLEKITVKELCQLAQINKSTFYSHYEDLYALSDALETEVVVSVLDSMRNPGSVFEDPAAFTVELFQAYLSQDSLIKILFSGNRSGQLLQKIETGLRSKIFADRQAQEDPVRDIVLSYCIYGGYHAFEQNRRYGTQRVISVLGEMTRETVKLIDWHCKTGENPLK